VGSAHEGGDGGHCCGFDYDLFCLGVLFWWCDVVVGI